ncbi:MAG: hypothetical protein ACOX5A_02460 [Aminivibrio sp.]|jgi:hypothetical protein|nr:hypothetical protein [Synergistaceae bacterium]
MPIEVKNYLSDDENEFLKGILGCTEENYEKMLSGFASAAFEEYCRMILGQKVYTRISDLKEYRLYLIIKEVFDNRVPDDQKISDLFQTTPTESRSLTRSIASKYQYELREAIKETLKTIIEQSTKENAKWFFTVNSPTKVEELNRILMSIDGRLPQVKKKKGTVSQYEMDNSSYTKLKEYFGL